MPLTDLGILGKLGHSGGLEATGTEMDEASAAAAIDRRIVLTAGAAFAAAGSALLLGGHAEAQARANRRGTLFAYVGSLHNPGS